MSKSDDHRKVREEMVNLIKELQGLETSTAASVEDTREILEQNQGDQEVPKGVTIH